MSDRDLKMCVECEHSFDGECRYRAPVVRVTFTTIDNFGLWSGFPTHPKTGFCACFQKRHYEPYKTDFQKAKISKAKKQNKNVKAKKKGKADV